MSEAKPTSTSSSSGEYIGEVIRKVDSQREEAKNSITALQTTLNDLRKYVSRKRNLFREEIQSEYEEKIEAVAESIGFAINLIVNVDTRKAEVAEQVRQDEQNKPPPTNLIVVNQPPAGSSEQPTAEVKGAGFRSWLGGLFKKKQDMRNRATNLIQGDKVQDVLEYGRQIVPLWNNLLNWHTKSFFRTKCYAKAGSDRAIMTDMEKFHIVKLRMATMAFAKASVLNMEGRIMEGYFTIAKAQAAVLKEIYPIKIENPYFMGDGRPGFQPLPRRRREDG